MVAYRYGFGTGLQEVIMTYVPGRYGCPQANTKTIPLQAIINILTVMTFVNIQSHPLHKNLYSGGDACFSH